MKEIIPSKTEYNRARKIVDTYETEQSRLYQIRVEAFRIDLTEYFKYNSIDGFFYLKSFELRNGNIIPKDPLMEENYNGGNDDDIKKFCKKHKVKFSIIYWCYHK